MTDKIREARDRLPNGPVPPRKIPR